MPSVDLNYKLRQGIKRQPQSVAKATTRGIY